MPRSLMPYGSSRHSALIVKEGGKATLADRLSSRLASKALSSTGGHFTKGGTPGGGGKHCLRLDEAIRLVRLNACKD